MSERGVCWFIWGKFMAASAGDRRQSSSVMPWLMFICQCLALFNLFVFTLNVCIGVPKTHAWGKQNILGNLCELA